MRGVTILGATGSIGLNTLDVITRHPQHYRVVALTANQQVQRMAQLCQEYRPEYAVMADPNAAEQLATQLRSNCPTVKVLAGEEGLVQVASDPDVHDVMAAIVGAAGLRPTLAAARAGKRVLLANKEALVMSGRIFMDEVKHHGAELLPIDSEHNAIFQCMPHGFEQGLEEAGVRRILLTGSGGPFRTWKLKDLPHVTPEQACAHPNWSMGKKISVDSATMMNKGLELIEACWLFNANPDQVQIVVHPQSIIHSMVEYIDGSILCQMGQPDMRTPIAHAFGWPQRMQSGVKSLNLIEVGHLDFEAPDTNRFPCLQLADQAVRQGGTSSALLNAANEVAVDAFLAEQIAFTDIPIIIEKVLGQITPTNADTLEQVIDADRTAREYAGIEVANCRKTKAGGLRK